VRQTRPVSGLRDQNKAKRRNAILDAAVSLLGTSASDDVTTEAIAARAGLSPATVYNLIGTREDLMHAVVERILHRLAASLGALDPADPIAAAQLVVDHTVAAFVADSAAYRQVVAFAQRASPDQPGLDPSIFQVEAMQRAQAMGIIRDDVDAGGLGRQIFLSYVGAMMLWSAGRLDDAGFLVAAQHGLATALASAATDAHRDELLGRMRTLGVALERDVWHRPSH
jgi:AcrR family transcriptional regulator